MFCIAAFIILAILGIFSASHRKLAKKAWHCVWRKITFRPCDISFGEEMKGKLLGKIIITHPRLAKFLDRWIDVLSFIFVILTIWSLWTAFMAGLNLWVYDTCNPVSAESCSLGGEACSLQVSRLSLIEAVQYRKLGDWISTSFKDFGETLSRVPDRFKNWKAEDYFPSTGVYYYQYDPVKPAAVEAIDPSCQFCRKLLTNIKTAGFDNTHNLVFILYPIPDATKPGGYKFPNSFLMASYIEATKKISLSEGRGDITPGAWQLLEKLFGTGDGGLWQNQFVNNFDHAAAEKQLQHFLKEIGYREDQIQAIAQFSTSAEVVDALKEQADIVVNKLKTVKIPTIVFGGRRYDRLIDQSQLH